MSSPADGHHPRFLRPWRKLRLKRFRRPFSEPMILLRIDGLVRDLAHVERPRYVSSREPDLGFHNDHSRRKAAAGKGFTTAARRHQSGMLTWLRTSCHRASVDRRSWHCRMDVKGDGGLQVAVWLLRWEHCGSLVLWYRVDDLGCAGRELMGKSSGWVVECIIEFGYKFRSRSICINKRISTVRI